MKKLFVLLLLFLIFGAASVSAQETEISIHIPDTFMKVQEYGEAYFNVRIKNCGETADFHLEYSRDNFETVYDGGFYNIPANGERVVKITNNLPKGSYVMSVRATAGEKEYMTSQRMAVMTSYQEQFMDDYTRIGVHVGLPAPSIAKSTFAADKRRAVNSLRLLTLSGIRKARFGTATTWEMLEGKDGELSDFNLPSGIIKDMPATSFVNLSVLNGKYGGVMVEREQMEHFTEYAKKRLTNDVIKSGQFAELGNEPDLESFWPGRDVWAIQYMNLARYASLAVRECNDDYSFIGGVTSGGTNAVPFLESMFQQQDGYKYLDGYSYHPYIKSSGVDGKYDSFTKAYEDAASGKGAWMQKMITEIGWNSAWEGTSSIRNHEEIAMEMTKVWLKTYLHDLDLTCYYSLVNNLGLQPQNDFSVASAAVVAATQITSKLNSALYVGEYPIAEGAMCAMFLRENKPLMVVWMPGEKSVGFKFDTPVTVEDIYGNVIYEGTTVEINSNVCYISGFGMNYIYKTAETVKNQAYAEVEQRYGDKFNSGIFDCAKTLNADNAAAYVKSLVDTHYDAGDALIDDYLAGRTELELSELSEALFTLHVAGEKLANVYSLTPDTGVVSNKYKSVRSKADERKGKEKNSTLLYTDKILKYSQRAYNKAKDAQGRENSVIKKGIISSCFLISDRLAGWAEKIMSVEEVDDTIGILTIAQPYSTEFYQSTKETEITYTVDNKRIKAIDGEIIVNNGEGETLGEAVPIKLEAGAYQDIALKIPNDYSNKEKDFYKICLVENGRILNEKLFPVTRQKVLDIELANAQTVFRDLKTVSVKITNNSPDTQKGIVKLSAPAGWSLTDSEAEYTVDGFETKYVSFEVSSKKQVPFNMYSFGVQVVQSDGMELFNKKLPLNFSVLVESSKEYRTESFDGDITDWQNAYPIYAGAPEDPDDMNQWKESDVAAIAFLKYDKNNIYILANVYDNIFHGKYTGTSMWRNDSLQMLFDPLNNGGDKPQSDDIAFITGHTSSGKETLKTLGPNGVTQTNNVPYENAVTVIRDNSINQTRYLVKIPIEAVAPLQSSSGTKFRFNICFNDSDVEDRNKVIQVTKGLSEGGAKRKPGLYYEFVMSGTDAFGSTNPEDLRMDLTMKSDPLDFK